MNTYVYAEWCSGRNGRVVIPQPEGKDRECDDYMAVSLEDCDSMLTHHAEGGGSHSYYRMAARNVLAAGQVSSGSSGRTLTRWARMRSSLPQ